VAEWEGVARDEDDRDADGERDGDGDGEGVEEGPGEAVVSAAAVLGVDDVPATTARSADGPCVCARTTSAPAATARQAKSTATDRAHPLRLSLRRPRRRLGNWGPRMSRLSCPLTDTSVTETGSLTAG